MQQNLFSPFSPFVREPDDYIRWSKQRRALFDLLRDNRVHQREELLLVTNAQNITAVVSELRHRGAVIECTRHEGQIYYQMTDWVSESTVKKGIHCPTCRCTGDRG
jgi:hypothetical protein